MEMHPIQLKDGTTAWSFPSSELKIEQHTDMSVLQIKKDDLLNGMNVKISFADRTQSYYISGTIAEIGADGQTVSLISRQPVRSKETQTPSLHREYKLIGFSIDLKNKAFKELDKAEVERLGSNLTNNRKSLEQALSRRAEMISQREEQEFDSPFEHDYHSLF